MVIAFGCVMVILAVLGTIKNELIWTLGPLAAICAALSVVKYCTIDSPGSRKEKRLFNVLALAFMGAWLVWNVFLASQSLFTGRDSAIYVNTAVHVMHHESLLTPVTHTFGQNIAHLETTTPWFKTAGGDTVYFQGSHVFPLFLGTLGRLGGESIMLRIGAPAIAALALLAVFGFARLFLRPRYAFLAMVTLGISLPMFYFSRDTYTEPLLMMTAFTGLSLLWAAYVKQHLLLWLMAGFVAGFAFVVRIDGLLIAAALMLGAFVLSMGSQTAKNILWHKQAAFFVLGLFAATGLAGLDLWFLSRPYYEYHARLVYAEAALLAAILAGGTVSLWLVAKTNIVKHACQIIQKIKVSGIFIAVIAIGLLLASRPLWMIDHTASLNSVVSGIQKTTGFPVEPRAYSEYSVQWLEWYLGPFILLLALVGLAVVTAKVASSKKYLLLVPFVLVFAGTAIVYLLEPSITPDQIWAMRRYLPIVIPGLIVLAFYALPFIAHKLLNDQPKSLLFKRAVLAAAIIGIVLPVVIAARPFMALREVTQLAPLKTVCQQMPKNAAIIWVWQAGNALLMPTRELCGIEAAKLAAYEPTKAQLKQMGDAIRKTGKEPFIGVFGNEASHIAKDYNPKDVSFVSEVRYSKMEQTLLWAPKQVLRVEDSLIMAKIQPDGSLRPLSQNK